jgi:hypothetical protein
MVMKMGFIGAVVYFVSVRVGGWVGVGGWGGGGGQQGSKPTTTSMRDATGHEWRTIRAR